MVGSRNREPKRSRCPGAENNRESETDMANWQTIFSLLIVALAMIQLIRLLTGTKNKCGSCSDRCSLADAKDRPLVQLEDLTCSEKAQQ